MHDIVLMLFFAMMLLDLVVSSNGAANDNILVLHIFNLLLLIFISPLKIKSSTVSNTNCFVIQHAINNEPDVSSSECKRAQHCWKSLEKR